MQKIHQKKNQENIINGFENALKDIHLVKFAFHDIFLAEIEMGQKLIWDKEKEIEVKAFRVFPTPRVWDGKKWYLLSNCEIAEDN